MALWFVSMRPLTRLLDESRALRSPEVRLLRQLARYETIRPLLAFYGMVIAAALLVGLFWRGLPLPLTAIALGLSALLLSLALRGDEVEG